LSTKSYFVLITIGLFCISCSKKNPSNTVDNNLIPSSIIINSGNNQTARVGSNVSTAPSVVVKNSNGYPLGGITVVFSIGSGEGILTDSIQITDTNGIAIVGLWTLGDEKEENSLIAKIQNSENLITTFNANSRWPYWNVLIYMAADNDLSISGIEDIDEIEMAGIDAEVNVIIQAEFNPYMLSLYGCNSSCFNRPNFNTFRYIVKNDGNEVTGPNGEAIDIGNMNMTDPLVLRNFVEWSTENHPAEKTLLILWNHGGGYTGLIQDVTSSTDMMSISDLRVALNGINNIDIIDFDMCLMASYETLMALNGLTQYVVFSENTVPGEGNPYTELINSIQTNSASNGESIAKLISNEFYQSYIGSRSSITVSAYDMNVITDLYLSISNIASYLKTRTDTLYGVLYDATENSQSFENSSLKDIGDLFGILKNDINDNAVKENITEVINAITGSNQLRNYYISGTSSDAINVDRSTGLSIFSPSPNDHLPNNGPGSFEYYQSLFPNDEWSLFLFNWTSEMNSLTVIDQGSNRFEAYLVWDPVAINSQVDIDFFVLEPNGNLYAPHLGSISPNGSFTNDSYYDNVNLEGYYTNRYIQVGEYKFYALLYSDPYNFQPEYDLAYRNDQTSEFQWLYDPDFPKLSFESSWTKDPYPTFEKVELGYYSDFHYVALLTVESEETQKIFSDNLISLTDKLKQSNASLNENHPSSAQLRSLKNLIKSEENKSIHENRSFKAPIIKF